MLMANVTAKIAKIFHTINLIPSSGAVVANVEGFAYFCFAVGWCPRLGGSVAILTPGVPINPGVAI
jgi:hypothetical protein